MAFGVFIHRSDSIYDDSPAERYQFPGQYLTRAQAFVGDWILYYEPRKVAETRGYFAVAKIQRIIPDPGAPGMYADSGVTPDQRSRRRAGDDQQERPCPAAAAAGRSAASAFSAMAPGALLQGLRCLIGSVCGPVDPGTPAGAGAGKSGVTAGFGHGGETMTKTEGMRWRAGISTRPRFRRMDAPRRGRCCSILQRAGHGGGLLLE